MIYSFASLSHLLHGTYVKHKQPNILTNFKDGPELHQASNGV